MSDVCGTQADYEESNQKDVLYLSVFCDSGVPARDQCGSTCAAWTHDVEDFYDICVGLEQDFASGCMDDCATLSNVKREALNQQLSECGLGRFQICIRPLIPTVTGNAGNERAYYLRCFPSHHLTAESFDSGARVRLMGGGAGSIRAETCSENCAYLRPPPPNVRCICSPCFFLADSARRPPTQVIHTDFRKT